MFGSRLWIKHPRFGRKEMVPHVKYISGMHMPRDPITNWNFKEFKGNISVSVDMPFHSQDPIGYTSAELKAALGEENFKQYCSWAVGNTVGVGKSGESLNYLYDVRRFLWMANPLYKKILTQALEKP